MFQKRFLKFLQKIKIIINAFVESEFISKKEFIILF